MIIRRLCITLVVLGSLGWAAAHSEGSILSQPAEQIVQRVPPGTIYRRHLLDIVPLALLAKTLGKGAPAKPKTTFVPQETTEYVEVRQPGASICMLNEPGTTFELHM